MNKHQPKKSFNFMRIVRKLFLSAFVVLSFAAYALHRPFTNSDASAGFISQTPAVQFSQQNFVTTPPPSTGNQPKNQAPANITTIPQPVARGASPFPTATTAVSSGRYKNGTYTGSEVDAFYGLVKVETTIQNGSITNVQFVEYPNDRRTSVRINTFAVPRLQQEAIQAQQANVNIITGATLTSEAFMMSLQSALDQAAN